MRTFPVDIYVLIGIACRMDAYISAQTPRRADSANKKIGRDTFRDVVYSMNIVVAVCGKQVFLFWRCI